MARPVIGWFVVGALAVSTAISPWALADDAVPLDQAIAAFEQIDADSGRSEVWNRLESLNAATASIQNHTPDRSDPQQEILDALAEHYLSDLVNAYARLEALRYYLRPLVEDEILRNGGPNLAQLDTIQLPQNANQAQAWVYIRDLVRATEGQRRISIHDPQVQKLGELAKDHMPLLLQTLDMPKLRYYASAAIRATADESHQQVIIDALLQYEELIRVVQIQGWAEQARDQVMRGLNQGVDYTPRSWVQVLASLEDPETYDTLCLQLYRERCSRYCYAEVKDLPGIDLTAAVFASWEKVHTSPSHARELREVSQIALDHGHIGALAHLISLLTDQQPAYRSRTDEVRQSILDHVDFTGTDTELREWFDVNQQNLRYSEKAGRFYVADGLN